MDSANKLTLEKEDKLSLRERNLLLNDLEYNKGNSILESTPEGIGIGAHYQCNARCVFCLGEKHHYFSFERYKEYFEPRIGPVISHARFVNFCGFGELLFMPGIEEFLGYVNEKNPEINKIYTTNGTPLKNNSVLKLLTESKSVVEISLHASYSQLHRQLTGMDTFAQIISGIKQLVSMRKHKNHPTISLIFLINTLNIEDLPDFVEFAAKLEVDEIICSYLTIFNLEHLKLSCFFKQEITNECMERAKLCAQKLKLSLKLPPKFKTNNHSFNAHRCSDPWKYCYVENEGSVLACCYAGSHFGYLDDKDFAEIWNGADYRRLRRSLADNLEHEWCRYCYKHSRINVDDLRAHINARPGFREEILSLRYYR